MKKTFTICTLMIALFTIGKAQTITGVTITNPAPPSDISECDQVEITITGTFPATNFTNTNFVPDFNGFQLDYNLYAESQGVGNPIITPFSEPVPTIGFFSPPGTYTLTIFFYNNNNLVDTYTTTLEIVLGVDPDPGIDTLIEVCSTDPPFTLISQLGGTPEPGGEWTDPSGNPHNGNFIPQTDLPGLYLYNIFAFPPCNPTFSSVTVVFTSNTDPGQNGTAFLCELDPPTDLFSFLGGNPVTGGTWTAPGGQAHTGILDPANDPQGNYKYTVTGVPPCGDPFALVNVMTQNAPEPGSDNSIIVLDSDPPFMLFDQLNGNPDTTGFWMDPNNISFGAWNVNMTPGFDFPGTYKYVAISLPCPNDTAFLEVEVVSGIEGPDANIAAMEVVPNPNNGTFQLDLRFNNAAEDYALEIVSLTGQVLFKEALATSGSTKFQQNMDLRELPKGVYFLRIASPTATTVRRIVLE